MIDESVVCFHFFQLTMAAIEGLGDIKRVTEEIIAEMSAMLAQGLSSTYPLAYGVLTHRRNELVQLGKTKGERIKELCARMGYELTSDAKKLLESLAGLGEAPHAEGQAQAPAPLAPSAIEDLRELSRMTEMVIAEMRSMVSQRLLTVSSSTVVRHWCKLVLQS